MIPPTPEEDAEEEPPAPESAEGELTPTMGGVAASSLGQTSRPGWGLTGLRGGMAHGVGKWQRKRNYNEMTTECRSAVERKCVLIYA